MLCLALLTVLSTDRLVPLIGGIVPGRTEIPELERRLGKAKRSVVENRSTVYTWHLKGGLILDVIVYGFGKEDPVANEVGIHSWKGSLRAALDENGLRTHIIPLQTLKVGARDTSVATTLHTILGKVPGQRDTYHSQIDLPEGGDQDKWTFLRFGWSRDNKLQEISQQASFK